jgi:hypothetical protein
MIYSFLDRTSPARRSSRSSAAATRGTPSFGEVVCIARHLDPQDGHRSNRFHGELVEHAEDLCGYAISSPVQAFASFEPRAHNLFAGDAYSPDIQALGAVGSAAASRHQTHAFRDARNRATFGKRSIDPIRNSLRTASTTSPVAVQSFALNKPRRKMSRLRLQANARRLGRRGDAACVHRTVDQAVDQSQLKRMFPRRNGQR